MPLPVVAAVAALIAEVAAVATANNAFQSVPPSAGYADFESQQSCNPYTDSDSLEGSYADPGACVCYDDSGSGDPVSPAQQPVTGDRPERAPEPAPTPQKAGGSAPQEPEGILHSLFKRPESEPTPILTIDTDYATFTIYFDPNAALRPGIAPSPIVPDVQVKENRIVEDLFGLNPQEDAPELPGDDEREDVKNGGGLGSKLVKGLATAAGAGGVADALSDVAMNMALEEKDLNDEQVTELARQKAVSSTVLVVELAKVLIMGRIAKRGGGESRTKPPRKMTVAETRKKLEIYKAKTGQPAPDVPGVTRTTAGPKTPSRLGVQPDQSVRGIWNENPNIEITVKAGANNATGTKSVELVLKDAKTAIPSVKADTETYRRGLRDAGLIPKGWDAGHDIPRSIVAFEDPANYFPERPTFNRWWKNLWVEAESRKIIREANPKENLTLKITQEFSQGAGVEEVVSTSHLLTSGSAGSAKTLLDVTLDITGKLINKTPATP